MSLAVPAEGAAVIHSGRCLRYLLRQESLLGLQVVLLVLQESLLVLQEVLFLLIPLSVQAPLV